MLKGSQQALMGTFRTTIEAALAYDELQELCVVQTTLRQERSDIVAAHICYLVAEANGEPYSDSARLCLVGADHWTFLRTYANPEAIQRTEISEYSKVNLHLIRLVDSSFSQVCPADEIKGTSQTKYVNQGSMMQELLFMKLAHD